CNHYKRGTESDTRKQGEARRERECDQRIGQSAAFCIPGKTGENECRKGPSQSPDNPFIVDGEISKKKKHRGTQDESHYQRISQQPARRRRKGRFEQGARNEI